MSGKTTELKFIIFHLTPIDACTEAPLHRINHVHSGVKETLTQVHSFTVLDCWR